MAMQKKSRKRDAILACVCSTDTHPTAEWVYTQLKPDIPDLSLGPVYDLPDIEPPVELMRRVTCGCPSTCELTFTGVCNDCISPDAGSKITI